MAVPRWTMRMGWVWVIGLAGCEALTPDTSVAIENGAVDTISVTLVAGDDSEVFSDIGVGLSSEARVVTWLQIAGVSVHIDAGSALPGQVDLEAGSENVIIVSDLPPVVYINEPAPAPSGGGGW